MAIERNEVSTAWCRRPMLRDRFRLLLDSRDIIENNGHWRMLLSFMDDVPHCLRAILHQPSLEGAISIGMKQQSLSFGRNGSTMRLERLAHRSPRVARSSSLVVKASSDSAIKLFSPSKVIDSLLTPVASHSDSICHQTFVRSICSFEWSGKERTDTMT